MLLIASVLYAFDTAVFMAEQEWEITRSLPTFLLFLFSIKRSKALAAASSRPVET